MKAVCSVACAVLCLAIWIAGPVTRADSTQLTFVICSPGSPGSTDEAQPRMDAFSQALATKLRMPVAAVYDPSDAGGVKRLQQAGVGLVSLPFFLAHERELALHARLQAVQKGGPALESWALVARKGFVKSPKDLGATRIVTSVASAPGFVRGVVLGGFGPLPKDVKIEKSTAVLSSLRKAADGEPIAVVVDPTQLTSMASLPFAAQLEVVARSPAVPAAVVVTIDASPEAKSWPKLEQALVSLGKSKPGAAALEAIEVARFEPVAEQALGAARKAYAGAAP